MPVKSTTAVVYHGGGRRYLTLRAACKAEARKLIKARCKCEHNDHGPYGIEWVPCWHHDSQRYPILIRRLTGGYMRRYRASHA